MSRDNSTMDASDSEGLSLNDVLDIAKAQNPSFKKLLEKRAKLEANMQNALSVGNQAHTDDPRFAVAKFAERQRDEQRWQDKRQKSSRLKQLSKPLKRSIKPEDKGFSTDNKLRNSRKIVDDIALRKKVGNTAADNLRTRLKKPADLFSNRAVKKSIPDIDKIGILNKRFDNFDFDDAGLLKTKKNWKERKNYKSSADDKEFSLSKFTPNRPLKKKLTKKVDRLVDKIASTDRKVDEFKQFLSFLSEQEETEFDIDFTRKKNKKEVVKQFKEKVKSKSKRSSKLNKDKRQVKDNKKPNKRREHQLKKITKKKMDGLMNIEIDKSEKTGNFIDDHLFTMAVTSDETERDIDEARTKKKRSRFFSMNL